MNEQEHSHGGLEPPVAAGAARVLCTAYRYLRRQDMRHAGLTWMANTANPVHVLRKIAGHGSLTTNQRYLHPDHRAITEPA